MSPEPAESSASPFVARALSFGYDQEDVLRQLELDVPRGEIFALLGSNGAGKSTLIQLALGLHAPRGGEILVEGFDPWNETASVRRHLAYVPENVVVYEQLTGFENLRYFLDLAGQGDLPDSRLEEGLEEVGLSENAWHRRSDAYSKGMRQKLALALATVRQATLLLLDEPTSGLDPTSIEDFHQMLLTMKSRGVTSLLVTHDLLGAATVADRLGFLSAGQIRRVIAAEGESRFELSELRNLYLGAGSAGRETAAAGHDRMQSP